MAAGGDANEVVQTIESGLPTRTPASDAEEISIITTGSRKAARRDRVIDEDEPLVDTTADLTLRSKKTERAEKRLQKKQTKAAKAKIPISLLDIPTELLQEIAGYLRPSDVLQLLQVNHNVRDFIQTNESAIARDIIGRRYWVLSRCFPLPLSLDNVDSSARSALLSDARQHTIQTHKKPYQHVRSVEPLKICTCMSCVMAWINLCTILDLSHWQKNLNKREPIPMIPRGTTPEWNRRLLDANAAIVEKAMDSRLVHAVILENHLSTTIQTIFRTFRGKKTVHPKRLYHLTQSEAERETDEFLERSGPPSYEPPWHRDNYYGLEAYVPNRKWDKVQEKWIYYAKGMHDNDLQWVKRWYTPKVPPTAVKEQAIEPPARSEKISEV